MCGWLRKNMCDLIWLINWEANQENYLAESKFEIQILKNQFKRFGMILIDWLIANQSRKDMIQTR